MQAAESTDLHIAVDNAYDLLLQDRKCEEGGRKKLDAGWWGTLDLLDVVSGKDRGTTAITHDGGRNNSSTSDFDMLFLRYKRISIDNMRYSVAQERLEGKSVVIT